MEAPSTFKLVPAHDRRDAGTRLHLGRSRGAPTTRPDGWHTIGTRRRKNVSHPPESNRRPA